MASPALVDRGRASCRARPAVDDLGRARSASATPAHPARQRPRRCRAEREARRTSQKPAEQLEHRRSDRSAAASALRRRRGFAVAERSWRTATRRCRTPSPSPPGRTSVASATRRRPSPTPFGRRHERVRRGRPRSPASRDRVARLVEQRERVRRGGRRRCRAARAACASSATSTIASTATRIVTTRGRDDRQHVTRRHRSCSVSSSPSLRAAVVQLGLGAVPRSGR